MSSGDEAAWYHAQPRTSLPYTRDLSASQTRAFPQGLRSARPFGPAVLPYPRLHGLGAVYKGRHPHRGCRVLLCFGYFSFVAGLCEQGFQQTLHLRLVGMSGQGD